MANQTNTTKKLRNYEDVKQSIISKSGEIRVKANEIRAELLVAIDILRNQEKKDKKAILEALKNDLVNQDYVGKTVVYDTVNYAFATETQKQEIEEKRLQLNEKKRILLSAGVGGSGQTLSQEGNEDEEEESMEDIRNRNKNNILSKNVKKGSSQMLKNAPEVMEGDLADAEEDDNDDDTKLTFKGSEDDLIPVGLLEHGNNIVIDDPEHLEEIGKLINAKKAVVIVVNKNLVPEGVKEGKSLT